jgi:hypothetical protein
VFCYDYHENWDLPETGPSFDSSAWASGRISEQFRALANITDTTTAGRVILVEDLSPTLIDALGDTFNLPADAFAEHLNQSGYSWDSYSHEPPTKWNNASISKSHVSLRWFRPVRQEKVVTGWLKNQEVFLKTRFASKNAGSDSQSSDAHSSSSEIQGAISWIDTHYEKQIRSFIESRKCHNIHATTNIFRQCWPLSMRNTKPDAKAIPRALDEQDYFELNPVAWEEKATLVFYRGSTIPISMCSIDKPWRCILTLSSHPST